MEDHIYVDISVLNNDRTGQAQNAPVSYNEARNSNILTDPDNYYMSIVRAQVDTGGYSGPPLLLPMVDLNNFNIDQDQLIYTISTATKSGATYDNLHTVNVHWNAQNQAAPPPSKTTTPVNPVALPPVSVSVGNASISATATVNTLDLIANAPVATINAAYVGSGVESNASIRYIWNAGTYDCAGNTVTVPGFTSPVDFTGWTIDTNPSDGTMLIESGSIVIEQNQTGSNLVLTLNTTPTAGTFTRTDNSTRQLLFINTSTPLFEPNTTITDYPQGLNPIVTISPSASLIVPSPQDAEGPPVQFFTALYNVDSNSSPIDLNPLFLHWGGPAPTINKYVGGIMTSNLTFAFAYNAGAPTSFAGSGSIITPSIVFTAADANNDTSYINNGQLAIIPGLTASISTVTSHTFSLYALQYTTFQNSTQLFSYNGSSLIYGNYLHVDASDPPQTPSVITNSTLSPALINYNYGFQTPCTFVLDAPNASMSFLDPSMGISALPLNYQAYYGANVRFDVLNSTIWFTTVAFDIAEISIINGNYVKILFGPTFSFTNVIPSTLASVRNVTFQFQVNPATWIAPSLPLTISSYTNSSTVTLTTAGTDPTTLLPFLFINFLAPATATTVFANRNFQMQGTPINTLAYQLNLQVNPPPIQNTVTPTSAVYINNCNFNYTSTVSSNTVPNEDGDSTFIVNPTWPTPYIPTTSNAPADLIYALITATITQPDYPNSWTGAIIGCVLDPIESQYALTSINTTTGYYSTFSVNWFIACMNAAFADLATQDNTNVIYMFADPLTNLITIKTPPAYLTVKYIFFNEPLAALFNCFTMQYIGNSGLPFATPTDNATVKARPYLLNYQLQIYKNNLETPDGQGFVSTTGLVSPVPAWSPILSVSFASNLIPHVLSNSTAAQSRTPSLTDIPSGQSQISNIITDITVPMMSGNEPRPQILYTPAIYRMIDLHGTQSLSSLDLQLFYKDKYGVLTPMRLGAQQFFSAKLLFRRRRFDLLNLAPYDN